MKEISLDTRAKINLTLDIINKRLDGYHNVAMVMQSITLCDTLRFRSIGGEGIKIYCDNPNLPTDHTNMVYKAAQMLQEKYCVKSGIEVWIEKRIPMAAGLAGGSTNAAGTIRALNELWNLKLGSKELLELGAAIGADVPFCMVEGTALAEGVGEKLTQMKGLPELYFVLVKPNIQISTPWAYGLIDVKNIHFHPDNHGMVQAIQQGDKRGIALKLSNVFETVIFEKYPELRNIKGRIKELGAMGGLMSGSGPTLYGVFYEENQAIKAKEVLAKEYDEVFVAQNFNRGGKVYGI